MSDNCVHAEQTGLGEFAQACFKMNMGKHTTCSDTSVHKLVNTPTSLLKIIQNGKNQFEPVVFSSLSNKISTHTEFMMWAAEKGHDVMLISLTSVHR